MKKVYMFMALLLMSGVIFAQVQKEVVRNTLSAVKVVKEINTMPVSHAKAVVDSLHYDGVQNDAIGTGGAVTFGAYAFFPAATLAPHATAGHSILSVKVYVLGATDVSSAELRFYSDTLSTNLLYSQAFVPMEGWNDVMLYTPLTVPSTGNLYIGYNIVATAGHPAGCDAGPTNLNGDWMVWGGHWTHLSVLVTTLPYNWNIRAMCGTVPTIPTAFSSPNSWAAGNVLITNSLTSGNFTLANVGAGTLTCSGISGLSAPFTTTLVPGTVSLASGAFTTFTFTYNPTVVGATNQTVVIATNGGNVTINLSGTGISCPAISTYPWTENFEGATFPPACWAMNDADGDGHNWEKKVAPGYAAHGGTSSAGSASYSGVALTPDNYLITPKFNINSAFYNLQYWVAAQDPAYPSENYSVMVSTTGTAPANFTQVFTEVLTDSAWALRTVPLAAYNGQNIYIAFRHYNVTDMFWMKLDDITVAVGAGINDQNALNANIYSNDKNVYVNVSKTENGFINIYDAVGQLVKSVTVDNYNMVINMSDVASGIYMVNVKIGDKVFNKKVVL